MAGIATGILAADSFRSVVAAVRRARDQKRAILWGMGGHVVKCGLADILLDLMRRGWVTGFVMNGAASIHDFEIAIAGQGPAKTWKRYCRMAVSARPRKPDAR